MSEWVPDILGDEFEQLTLPLGKDDEGEVVATLVRALPVPLPQPAKPRWFWQKPAPAPQPRPLEDVDILYVHGWSDYFFNKRLARTFTDLGARFFALDLRKYGRSLREGQTPGFITDLTTYDEDIAAARDAMGTGRRLVLFGHSTGGLVLSLWANRHPDAVSALILNSPWLELQFPVARMTLGGILELTAKLRPLDAGPQLDLGYYARAQNEVADPDDPVEINLDWRPEHTMKVYAGWLNAIVAGHNKVDEGLTIPVPVCVMLSQRSQFPTKWTKELTEVDSVLVVDDIARAALKLGSSVTIERIDGALHDIFLSRHDVRTDAYARLTRWVKAWTLTL